MAGMRGDGRFQQKRSNDEYNEAAARATALGHGGITIVAEETGIPFHTLREKVKQYKADQGTPEPTDAPPLPNDNAIGEMADIALEALWTELHRIASPEAIQAKGKADVKAIGDIGTATKNWLGLGKTQSQTKPTRSALAGLSESGSSSGERKQAA